MSEMIPFAVVKSQEVDALVARLAKRGIDSETTENDDGTVAVAVNERDLPDAIDIQHTLDEERHPHPPSEPLPENPGGDLATVARFRSETQATFARADLADAGIPAFIVDSHMTGAYGGAIPIIAIRLQVPVRSLLAAAEVLVKNGHIPANDLALLRRNLESDAASSNAQPAGPPCPNCGPAGRTTPHRPLLRRLMGAVFFVFGNHGDDESATEWRCQRCGMIVTTDATAEPATDATAEPATDGSTTGTNTATDAGTDTGANSSTDPTPNEPADQRS